MTAPTLSKLKVKLFTDGADKAQIVEMAKQPWIVGFTTNPSLLKKAGVSDYAAYARDLVAAVPDRHISFEVFSDDVAEMVTQARVITTWGKNVYVKLPVTNTRGEPLFDAVRALSREGVNINMVTTEPCRTLPAESRGVMSNSASQLPISDQRKSPSATAARSVFSMFARVRVPGSPPYEGLLVPDVAIGTEQARRYVVVVDDQDTARIKYVTLGQLTSDNLRVIKGGIDGDDRVVVDGLMQARPGTKVHAEEKDTNPAQAGGPPQQSKK